MFPIHAQGNESIIDRRGIFPGEISDEEIDVINDDEGNLIPRVGEEEEHFQHPEDVFMVNEDEVFDEEGIQYGAYIDDEYESEQQYEGILENPEIYNAHYISGVDDYVVERPPENLLDQVESPENVDIITIETRMEQFPEMKALPPFRRFGKSAHVRPDDWKIWKCGKTVDPEAGPVEALLHANKFYPTKDDVKEEEKVKERITEKSKDGDEKDGGGDKEDKAKDDGFEEPEKFLSKSRLSMSTTAKARHAEKKAAAKSAAATTSESQAAPSEPAKEPVVASSLQLTPLPDRYFQKRLTITPEQAGFVSECIQCSFCHFMFRNKSALKSHINKHNKTGQSEVFSFTYGLICPIRNCSLRSDCIATVVQHMKTTHSVNDIVFERIVFKDITEFKMWRTELERLTMSRFCRTSGRQNTFSKSTYYQCHHSGVIPATRVDKDDSRKIRTRQSKKLGKTCTAFFHIKENGDGTVLLRGCTKHTGHGIDVRQLPLSEDIKMEIAHMLIEGYDEMSIVDKMRETYDKSNRRFYLQSYEIRNVAVKIERIKEEFKRRLANGEPLPDLSEMINEKRPLLEREIYPVTKAKLACHRYPVAEEALHDEYVREVESPMYEDDDYFNNAEPDPNYEVVIEDGLFNVPVAPNVEVFTEGKKPELIDRVKENEKYVVKLPERDFVPKTERKRVASTSIERLEAIAKSEKFSGDAIRSSLRKNAAKKKRFAIEGGPVDFEEEEVEVDTSNDVPTIVPRNSARLQEKKVQEDAVQH